MKHAPARTASTPFMAFAALTLALVAHAAPPQPVPGEVIVKFKPGAASLRAHALSARDNGAAVAAALAGRASALGARMGRTLEAGAAVGEGTQVVRASGVSAEALAAQLAADPEVEYAVPNGRARRFVAPADPLYSTGPTANTGTQKGGPVVGQWYLRTPAAAITSGPVSSIDIEPAWARTEGSGNVVVAVLDTGTRYDHPDLAKRLVPGYDMVADPTVANDGSGRDADANDPGDWVTAAETSTSTFSGCSAENSSWHGTGTAALVGGAKDSAGMVGAAPGARVLPVRVLGKCYGVDSDIQAGMRWAAGIAVPGLPTNPHPAKVLNMSLGSSGTGCSAAYQAVVNEVLATGAVIVAAAGNSAGGPVGSPGNCRGVIAVLALRHAGTKVGFSDLGSEITIAAPGGNCINITAGSPCLYPILTAANTGTTVPVASTWTDSFNPSVGTSFSSPIVAGVAALMFSRQPALTPTELRAAMQSTARAFPTTGAGNGTNGQPVPQCHAPASGVDQDQCYCTTTYCGAGMLDAGVAVNAVSSSPYVTVTATPATPAPGQTVSFTITGNQNANNRPVQSYAWTLLDGGGVATGFSTATNASTASILAAAVGTARVRLTLTDDQGGTVTTEQSVTAAVPVVESAGSTDSGGGGGGAASVVWVLCLLLATLVLLRQAAPGWTRIRIRVHSASR